MMDATAEVDAGDSGFAIRANNRLSAVLGVASSLLAIAYFARAVNGGSIDVIATVVFAAFGVHQLWTVFDARIPLLTADESLVRIRLGREWLGLPWSTIEQVVVEHRDGPIRDGRVVIIPRNLGNALEALPPRSRRAVMWQKRLHGAPLSVPLSIATRSYGVTGSVTDTLKAFSQGRAEIVGTHTDSRLKVDLRGKEGVPSIPAAALVEAPLVDPADAEPTVVVAYRAAIATVGATREARPANRAEIVREKSRQIREAAVDAITPINDPRPQLARASFGAVVHEAVVGSLVRAARERAGLSIDVLAERTTIRPHVLEGIEVDDFSACGGDFYARGHLRTLARFLGLNPGDLTAKYDELYARAPISARRVFEAELATSLGSGVRVRSGGPRWSLIAAAVLGLLMVWGVARFMAPASSPMTTASLAGASANNSAVSSVQTTPISSPLMQESTVVIGSLAWSAQVTVATVARVGHPSTVVWQGPLKSRQKQTLTIAGPFTIQSNHGDLTTVAVNGQPQGYVGTQIGPGARTFN